MLENNGMGKVRGRTTTETVEKGRVNTKWRAGGSSKTQNQTEQDRRARGQKECEADDIN